LLQSTPPLHHPRLFRQLTHNALGTRLVEPETRLRGLLL
jgi:hypothetical protein